MKENMKKITAISKTLNYLNRNNITIIKESEVDEERRNFTYTDLLYQRKKLKKDSKPEDSDLDILSAYKAANVDCILTINFYHFIDLGKYLDIHIERVWYKDGKEMHRVNNMIKSLFWKDKSKKKHRKRKFR